MRWSYERSYYTTSDESLHSGRTERELEDTSLFLLALGGPACQFLDITGVGSLHKVAEFSQRASWAGCCWGFSKWLCRTESERRTDRSKTLQTMDLSDTGWKLHKGNVLPKDFYSDHHTPVRHFSLPMMQKFSSQPFGNVIPNWASDNTKALLNA